MPKKIKKDPGITCRFCDTAGHAAIVPLPGRGPESARCIFCLGKHIEQQNAQIKSLQADVKAAEEERIGESINDGRRDIAEVLVGALQPDLIVPLAEKMVVRIVDDPYDGIRELIAESPVPIILFCPSCNARHIDEGTFATKPHHTHSCQYCGFTWRPAVAPTVGVRFLPGFKDA